MTALTRESLFSLEQYSVEREAFRTRVLDEKKNRAVFLGEHVVLLFENKLTIQYQVQEMLRIEKIFEAEGINEELEAYNPLIPDGENLKATMMIQYDDVAERREKLVELYDIENQIWVQAGDAGKVVALADEDLERADETKTSAVHFLRFQLTAEQIAALKQGGALTFGCSHPRYPLEVTVDEKIRASLVADLS